MEHIVTIIQLAHIKPALTITVLLLILAICWVCTFQSPRTLLLYSFGSR